MQAENTPRIIRQTSYDKDIDFSQLAEHDKSWRSVYQAAKAAGERIDFQDPDIVFQLTKSILKADFGLLSFEVPRDRLCPPVPVRWNYVRWVQELLDSTSDNYSDRYDEGRDIAGLDIGVGASAIYPLLACSTRHRWRMAGTDIDSYSLDYARKNITSNHLSKRIKVLQTTTDSALIPLDTLGLDEIDFVMTNPPFYSSESDMHEAAAKKNIPPSAICTGSANEMVYPGGDVGFISRLVDESLSLKTHVQWYTAMLGKLSSLKQIVTKLKSLGITNFAVTSLQAGHQTNRWAVAWSFQNFRPLNEVVRHGNLVPDVLPSPTAQTIVTPALDIETSGARVNALLITLNVRWSWKSHIHTGMMEAQDNVWSRVARRKQKFTNIVAEHGNESGKPNVLCEEKGDDQLALAVKIICKQDAVVVHWKYGAERKVFESFCGFLKHSLAEKT